MKQTINSSQFIDGFRIRPDNFSYDGLQALYDYFTDLEDDLGEDIEFDPIAICCEYSEFADLEEFRNDYGDEYESIDDIENETTVIRVDDNSFIIQSF